MRKALWAGLLLWGCGTEEENPKPAFTEKPIVREGECQDFAAKYPQEAALLTYNLKVIISESLPAFHGGTLDLVLNGSDPATGDVPACEFFRAQLTQLAHPGRTRSTLSITLGARINSKLHYRFVATVEAKADSGGATVLLHTPGLRYFPGTQTTDSISLTRIDPGWGVSTPEPGGGP